MRSLSPIRHSGAGRNLFPFRHKIPTFVGMTLLLLTLPALAQEKEPDKTLNDIVNETVLPDGAVRYAPEGCDFEITFPSEPYTTQRCRRDPKTNTKNCTKLTSYTMVYDVTTTIEVSVTCTPSTPADYKRYSQDVISLALRGMVSRGNVTEHEINVREEGDTRQGSLLGSAKRGKQNSIYNAQIWVGQNSIMSMESKLIGPFHAEADTVFSGILASVKKNKTPHKTK